MMTVCLAALARANAAMTDLKAGARALPVE